MSATGRGAARQVADFYPTPAWCVRRLLERLELPGGTWLEPAAGEGAIIRAVNSMRSDLEWYGFEKRQECRGHLVPLVENECTVISNFLSRPARAFADVVITNPPYWMAMEYVVHALAFAPWVVMLLRLNFLGSEKRSAFFRREMPNVYVLPNRPSFTGGGTDATEYAWFVWTPERGRRSGRQEVLAATPASDRLTMVSKKVAAPFRKRASGRKTSQQEAINVR